jgi:hypothetical protein
MNSTIVISSFSLAFLLIGGLLENANIQALAQNNNNGTNISPYNNTANHNVLNIGPPQGDKKIR